MERGWGKWQRENDGEQEMRAAGTCRYGTGHRQHGCSPISHPGTPALHPHSILASLLGFLPTSCTRIPASACTWGASASVQPSPPGNMSCSVLPGKEGHRVAGPFYLLSHQWFSPALPQTAQQTLPGSPPVEAQQEEAERDGDVPKPTSQACPTPQNCPICISCTWAPQRWRAPELASKLGR